MTDREVWGASLKAGSWVRVDNPLDGRTLRNKLVKMLSLEGDHFWRVHVRGRKRTAWIYESEVAPHV